MARLRDTAVREANPVPIYSDDLSAASRKRNTGLSLSVRVSRRSTLVALARRRSYCVRTRVRRLFIPRPAILYCNIRARDKRVKTQRRRCLRGLVSSPRKSARVYNTRTRTHSYNVT